MKIWNMALVMPIALCALLACSAPVETSAKQAQARFEYQKVESPVIVTNVYVMTDTVTGVQYLVTFGVECVDVTPLLEVNGRPYKEVV